MNDAAEADTTGRAALDPNRYATPEARLALLQDESAHQRRLRVAAGINTVELRANIDTWLSVRHDAFGFFAFGAPSRFSERDKDGLTVVMLSGSQLISVLEGTRREALRKRAVSMASRLLAERVYAACALSVDTVEAGNTTGERPDPIVVDDRATKGR